MRVSGYYIQWIDPTTASAPVQVYLERLFTTENVLNQSTFSQPERCRGAQTFIHQKVLQTSPWSIKKDDHRKLSVICYLNENWKESDGGQLRVYFPNDAKDFFPISGRLICFRSDLLEHEVLPTERHRISLTGWMLDQVVDLRQL